MPIPQADLEASLWVAPGADFLVLPVGSALGTKLAKELEGEVWELIEDLVEHASKLRENVTDGGVQNLWELTQTRYPELESVQRTLQVSMSNGPH
jgi:hypothetical protein